MASHRALKLKLHAQNPRCHWCGRVTVLTNVKEIKGQPDPLMATIDHLISRYDVRRWVKAGPDEKRKVLACFECNNKRASEESKRLPPGELSKRGTGFTLNPKKDGQPIFNDTVETLEEALKRLKEHGVEVAHFESVPEYKNTEVFGTPVLP